MRHRVWTATKAVVIVSLVAGLAGPASATEWHVGPAGKPGGGGDVQSPWDLQTALDGGADARGTIRIGPGDLVWLHGGTYLGGFRTGLKGEEGKPITFRQAPGEHAVIDCKPRDGKDSGMFDVQGDWIVLRGLEFTCSEPRRVTKISGSWPEDMRRGGISSHGSHNAYINLIVHDTLQGFGFWGTAEKGVGGEIYGCLIYNNGWRAPDRGHGHAIYAQNEVGTKRLVDNILFNQFGYGIHAYGSEKAHLRGFHIEGNACFNNGSLSAPGERSSDLFVGGGSPVDRLSVLDNYTYGGGGLRLGYASDVRNRGVLIKGNTFAGGSRFTALDQCTFTGNTLIAPGTLLFFDFPSGSGTTQGQWDHNTYFRTKVQWSAFAVSRNNESKGLNFAEWQKQTGMDAHSRYLEASPRGVKVVVRPNRYEEGRAHVIVYNWDKKDAVELDLKDVLRPGQPYRIVSAQDFHGAPVVSGTYEGTPLALPMKPVRAVRPVGMPDYDLPVTEPEFGAFVVLPATAKDRAGERTR